MTTSSVLFILYVMSFLIIVLVVVSKIAIEKQVEDNEKLLKIIIEILEERKEMEKQEYFERWWSKK